MQLCGNVRDSFHCLLDFHMEDIVTQLKGDSNTLYTRLEYDFPLKKGRQGQHFFQRNDPHPHKTEISFYSAPYPVKLLVYTLWPTCNFIMDPKPSVLILSSSSGVRLLLSQILKNNEFSDIHQPKVAKPEEIMAVLVAQFKTNLTSIEPSEKRDLIIINCRNNIEYRRSLETLSKDIMKNRIKWSQDGINFTHDEINAFKDACIIAHFVLGADFVYQIESNIKVQISFGDINTNEFLSCAILFGELGIPFSSYFEKDMEPTSKELKEYNEALQKGKQAVVKRMAEGNATADEISEIMNQKVSQSTIGQKAKQMEARLLKDIKTSLDDRKKKEDISKKRMEIVESADVFKQYLALKDEALQHKEKKDYAEMEKILKKAIELLENAGGESGNKSLFDTYIDLGKSQMQQKKYISSQRNAVNAKKIRKEAPSPQRLMGECQMGQATDALKSGKYDEAARFFDRAGEYMEESKKLAKSVEEDEQIDNEKEIATTITEFNEEAQKIAEEDPEAKKILQNNITFNTLAKTASDFKKKHKIVGKDEISPDITLEEIAKKLEEANKLLKTPADPGDCNTLLIKLFTANAEAVAEQFLSVGGLLSNILNHISDPGRYERALVFVRFVMGQEISHKEQIANKFREINLHIAKDQLSHGAKLLQEVFKDSDHPENSKKKNKAIIHFQKALHQNTDILEEVITMSVEQVKALREEFGNAEGLLTTNMLLKVEFSGEEEKFLGPLKATQKKIQQIMEKAKKTALEAAELVLQKKQLEAREVYTKAVKMDEMSAFKAVNGMASDFKHEKKIKEAYILFSWLARVDRNETDLQYINAAWCCLLLRDRERAKKHVEAALHINKNVIQEAREMDPEFEKSEVMKFYIEEWEEKKEKVAAKPPPPTVAPLNPKILSLIKNAAKYLSARDQNNAHALLKKLHQYDSKAFAKVVAQKPAVKNMPIYTFYQNKFATPAASPTTTPKPAQPFSKNDLLFVMEANKLFNAGKKRDAIMKIIEALKKDKLILVKACGASAKFKQSGLMKFYFDNKAKFPKFLGFEPQP